MTRLLVFCVALLLSVPAYAAPAINQAGADALKTKVQAMLDNTAANYKKNNQALKLTGDLTVEAAGTYYAVTTPSIAIHSAEGTRTIGMLAVNAMPTDDPDVFKIAMAVPTPITDTDKAGNVYNTITIGKQSLTGQVLLKTGAPVFLDMDSSYADIHMINTATDTEINVPSMTMTVRLAKDAKNPAQWAGPTEKTLQGATYRAGNVTLRIGSLHTKSQSSGITFDKASGTQWPLIAPVRHLLGNNMLRFSDTTMGTASVADVTFTDGIRTYTAKSASLQTHLSAMLSEKKNIAWDMKVDGVTSDDPTAAKVLPTTMTSRGSAKNLLLDRLVVPNAPIKKLLADGGSEITVDHSYTAPATQIKGGGIYTGDAKLPGGGSGSFTATMTGLEEVAAWAASPSAMQSAPIMAPLVTFLQLTAPAVKDAQGRMVRTYRLEYTKDGKTLFNGNDTGMLMQLLSPTTPTTPRSVTSAPISPLL